MRSQDLPAPDRFEWWREQMASDTAPTMISSPQAGDFRAVVTFAELGPVQLSVLSQPEMYAVRTPALIRRSDPERYAFSLITASTLWIAQRDHESLLEAGDLLLHETSRPFAARTPPGPGLGRVLMLHFPKAALPVRSRRLDSLLARRLRTGAGMTEIFARYLASVASALERHEVGEPEAERLGEVALDLAAATLAAQVDAQDQLAPETRRQALLSRIEAFIEHNLADPDLTPTVIAAHHHISVGYLHRIFQPRELTVAAWIRHRRLERCRADLTDPRLARRPIRAVGARWGFRDSADFSRAFRAAYGMPPSDYRRLPPAAVLTGAGAGVDPASSDR